MFHIVKTLLYNSMTLPVGVVCYFICSEVTMALLNVGKMHIPKSRTHNLENVRLQQRQVSHSKPASWYMWHCGFQKGAFKDGLHAKHSMTEVTIFRDKVIQTVVCVLGFIAFTKESKMWAGRVSLVSWTLDEPSSHL